MCEFGWNRERQGSSLCIQDITTNAYSIYIQVESEKDTQNTINSIFHMSYIPVLTIASPMRLCICVYVCMCSLESAFGVRLCACVCVCMQTETENNNKQSCERKRKRRRTTSSWQAHRESFGACYISILKSKRNITMYAVTVAVVDVVVVVLASCCKETLYRLCHCMSVCVSFFLLFFRLICFCCFSFLAR